MKRLLIWFLGVTSIYLFLFAAFGSASQETFTLNFDPSDLVFEKAQDYDRVRLPDCTFPAQPGTPLLPVRYVQIAIPADLEVVRVEVISFEYQELAGTYNIYPAQPFQPISKLLSDEKIEFVEPNPSVYELSTEYPGELAQVTNNGFLAGQHIAGAALYPIQYIPAEGKLILYTRIEFKLIFEPSSHSPLPVNRRSQKTAEFYANLARSAVVNPEDVRIEIKGSLSQSEEVDYLIITDASFIPAFQELADWKILKGISTEIRDVSWVVSSYPGCDYQEKIRNCIREYYSNCGTKWVLLGGDTDVVRHRTAWVSTNDKASDFIPCDLYYSDLDSNWDANGNHIFGEYEDKVDMYPDVFVGRAPCGDLSEAQTFVSKSLTYEINPPTDYLTNILYAAEVLWPGTDAAELKNYIDTSLVPDHFQSTPLYQSSGNLNRSSLRSALNDGQNIVNHAGHGNVGLLSIGSDVWLSSDMDQLANSPHYSLFYTYACISAAIDMDCIAEHFINNPDGGGFAYCGNTRYGWGCTCSPLHGPGPEFDIEFFRVLFECASYHVGRTLATSKIPFISLSQEPSSDRPYYRWTMYTLLLLGDPTLELWTNSPLELTVSHPEALPVGAGYLEVNVAQDSALVSCVKDGQVLATAYSSGGTATVVFESPPQTTGVMHVTVTKHNHFVYHETIFVIPAEEPYLIYHAHHIDDSQGNHNDVVNPGETILMSITIKNIGAEDAQNVSATLREEDIYVAMLDSVKDFGNIGSGMTADSWGDYVFEVDASCPDSHLVRFDLEATDGEMSWVSDFSLMVAEPDLVITSIPDTAVIGPGDSSTVNVVFTSLGGFDQQIDLSFSELPLGVSGFLDPDQLVPTDSSVFRLFAAQDASPGIHPVTITATGGGISREKEIVLGITPSPYYGPVWYVSPVGHDGIGNGSEAFPFRTIQKGIDSASDGDTVLVERGVYVERIDFSGKAILVASQVIFDGLESTIESTVIDGDYRGSVVTFDSGEDSTSIIRGFTITRGFSNHGSGICCVESSPTILENHVIRDSSGLSESGGVGIYCWASRAKIYRNVIADNCGPAAVFLNRGSYAELTSNTICNNSCGGLSVQNSIAYAKNNIFYGNVSYGIHISESPWDIAYNDVYGHEENYSGIDDQTGIKGNISADPLFEEPSAGNYRLTPASPCIDAGAPTDSIPPGGGTRIDMGALEYRQEPDFVITLFPKEAYTRILVGDSASFKLIVTSYEGFDSPVDLRHSELPPGVIGTFEPQQLVPTDSSFLRIQTAPDVSPGVYPVAITATGGGVTHHRHVVLYISTYFGPVWHVSTEGDDAIGDGSEESPFRTIQRGIDDAWTGDTVLVRRGIYVENVDFCGKPILVSSRFIFDGMESTIESTVIDGDHAGSVVSFRSGEDSNSVIRGFTLTRGWATYGGGVYCYDSSPTVAQNFILDNECTPGKGGPGVYCGAGSNAMMYRNLIANCSGPAAILVHDGCNARVVNNTICSNSWGGLSVQRSSVYAKNNIVSDNVSYGIHMSHSSGDIYHNDVYGHYDNYLGIDDQTGINGNISADPLFEDPMGDDYHLTPPSPCVDSGAPADSVPPGGGERIDMGAFEYLVGPDFAITVVPEDACTRLLVGDSSSFRLILTSYAGFDSPVGLSHSELPPGVGGFFEPDELVPTDSSVFRIYTTPNVTPDVYPVTVTATAGGITHQRVLELDIRTCLGPVWHVSTEGDDASGDGSEEFPYRTIQKAINTAWDGDTVLVKKGTYEENIKFRGKGILVASHFIFDGLESTIESTAIHGGYAGSVVTFNSNEDSNSVIRGLTLTEGYALYGGGIHCDRASPLISDNLVVKNECKWWGCPGGAGPGIYLGNGSKAKMRRNVVVNCTGAAAIYVHLNSDAQVINNTVSDNSWGGISVAEHSHAYIKNNVFCNNVSYGVHERESSLDISYNDSYGHEYDYWLSPDPTGIDGNISADPLFVNPSDGDYHLNVSSPCINAGDPADSTPPGGGDRVDMGAFEYTVEFVRGDANGDGRVGPEDIVYLINYLFREGRAPYSMAAADANGDGEVNAGDVVYLIQYLFHGGPPPLAKGAAEPGCGTAQLWCHAKGSLDSGGAAQVIIKGTFEVDITAVQLAIEYDPQELALDPVLPPSIQALQMFSKNKPALLKVGVLDLKGENWISPGRGVGLLILNVAGTNLNTIAIKEAVLVNRNGFVIPTKVLDGGRVGESKPERFSLSQNYPNPFNPQTQIRYTLPVECRVRITIYNLLGQRVKVLVDEHQKPGYRRVHWDGKDMRGADVASGVYFYKIEAEDFVACRKMVLMK